MDFEDKIFVHPVVGLLVERAIGKGVADVEDIGIDLFVCVGG